MKTATRIARPTDDTSTDQTPSTITEPETEPTERPLSPWAAAMEMVVGAFWAIGEILGNSRPARRTRGPWARSPLVPSGTRRPLLRAAPKGEVAEWSKALAC